MFDRTVFHIDVNSAFLSWEAVYRKYHLQTKSDLRDQVAAVGGDIAMRHGIILAKSIPAKKYQIKTGESILEAKQKCPSLIIVPPNYTLYTKCSKAFLDILKKYSPCVEQYSIDEAFVDMTETQQLFKDPVSIANHIKNEIRDTLGFTVNIGISSNKLLAKMASDFLKPDMVHTLWPEEVKEKMWPLPVSDLFFVGRATEKKLYNMGIHTIGELARTDPKILKLHLKKHGEVIWRFANGIDVSIVQKEPQANKGYGNSTTIAFDVCTAEVAKLVLLSLAETVSRRLRAAKVQAKVLSVSLKFSNLTHVSHQMVLDNATDITREIHQYACQLFDELWDGKTIRHMGIHATQISDLPDTRQLDLFRDYDYEKVNYSATSYRASCFNHHCQTMQKSIDRSHMVSTSVRFGLSQPYHILREVTQPPGCAAPLFLY